MKACVICKRVHPILMDHELICSVECLNEALASPRPNWEINEVRGRDLTEILVIDGEPAYSRITDRADNLVYGVYAFNPPRGYRRIDPFGNEFWCLSF